MYISVYLYPTYVYVYIHYIYINFKAKNNVLDVKMALNAITHLRVQYDQYEFLIFFRRVMK